MCVINLKMRAYWKKHKHFKNVYFLYLSDRHFIAEVIKNAYCDFWKVEILDVIRDEEFLYKEEAMRFVENNLGVKY